MEVSPTKKMSLDQKAEVIFFCRSLFKGFEPSTNLV